jgi:hypothetical protein
MERVEEKNRICTRLFPDLDSLTVKEQKFILDMLRATKVSVKQLFYLRDISEKY